MVPDIVWMWLEDQIEPNPLRYVDLCKVCRSSYYIFAGDRPWNKVSPFKCAGAYEAFYKRVGLLSAHKVEFLVDLWRDQIYGTKTGVEYEQEQQHMHLTGDLAFAYACWKAWQCKGRCVTVRGPFDERDFVLSCVRLHSCLILSAPQFWNDLEVLRVAIEGRGHFPVRQINVEDVQLCELLIKKYPSYVVRAPPELHTVENFMAAIEEDPYNLMAAPLDVRNHKALVLSVVRANGELLELASDNLQWDEDVVMAAVRNTGLALQFAKLKTFEIVMEAISVGGGAPVDALGPFMHDINVARRLVEVVPEARLSLPLRMQRILCDDAVLHGP